MAHAIVTLAVCDPKVIENGIAAMPELSEKGKDELKYLKTWIPKLAFISYFSEPLRRALVFGYETHLHNWIRLTWAHPEAAEAHLTEIGNRWCRYEEELGTAMAKGSPPLVEAVGDTYMRLCGSEADAVLSMIGAIHCATGLRMYKDMTSKVRLEVIPGKIPLDLLGLAALYRRKP